MTRKDYILIAQTIKGLDECLDEMSLEATASALAGALAGDNPNFDRERFLTACGVK
jgi:hypothetical protein